MPDITNMINKFGMGVIKKVWNYASVTLSMLVLGGIVGGFFGTIAPPFIPLTALAGAIILGTIGALWEYMLGENTTAHDMISDE